MSDSNKPKCKFCGGRHWSTESCPVLGSRKGGRVLPETPEGGADAGTVKSRSKAKPKNPRVWSNGDADNSPAVASSSGVSGRAQEFESPTRAKFDRNAYQREYMRGWRARQTEERRARKNARDQSGDS